MRYLTIFAILIICLCARPVFAVDVIKYPVGAATDLDAGAVVKVTGDNTIALCDEGDEPVGVITAIIVYPSDPDSYLVQAEGLDPGLEIVAGASNVTAGDKLVPANGGTIQPLSDDPDGHIVGVALKDGVAGDKIRAIINIGIADGDWQISGNDMYSLPTGNVGIGTTSPQHALDVDGAIYSRRNALTYNANITIDWNNGNIQSVILTGNTTLTFTNGQDGGEYTLIIKQDDTGNRTVTWPADVRWSNGTTVTLTTTANKTDYIGFIYTGIDSKYDVIAEKLNF